MFIVWMSLSLPAISKREMSELIHDFDASLRIGIRINTIVHYVNYNLTNDVRSVKAGDLLNKNE
jgi:hypothetical protein